MTPVVSPWIFYIMYVVDNIIIISMILLFTTLICGVIFTIVCSVECYDSDEFKEKAKPFFKVLLPIFIISCITASIVPDETTITKMIVAQNVTYERVEMAADTVEKVYNDIMGLFEDGDS